MDSVRPAEGVVTVRGDADGFAQEIAAGAHRLRSDEPLQQEEQTAARHRTTCYSLRSVPAPR